MNKKPLAFVDHIFHIKSKSGDFLREIFKKEYTITNIWVDKSLNFSDKIESFEDIFFFQIFPKVETLNTLFHECLHIKYPKMHENDVRKMADKMIPIRPEPKKKRFDIVHKK